ncbi:MAG: hypothetical protein HC822_23225 [Oscillochloris sp.]|nr:hypothetical protein [Oscillochloris sp.]
MPLVGAWAFSGVALAQSETQLIAPAAWLAAAATGFAALAALMRRQA